MKYQYRLQEPDFRVTNIDVQDVSRPKGYKHFVRNGREKHAFIFVESGEMLYCLQGEGAHDIALGAGEMLFLPHGCVYIGIYHEEGTRIKMVQFDLISGSLPSYLTSPTLLRLADARELIESFFRQTDLLVSHHPFYYLSRFYELLWRIDSTHAELPARYKKLLPALSELAKHWDQSQKVPYYAALCDMSEAAFRRSFREYTGMSPIDYRNDLRLRNAKSKLQSGEYSVSEAAYACGFSNLSFFIRLYKKKYGCTPKKAR